MLVRIKGESVRENPNAGRSHYQIAGRPEYHKKEIVTTKYISYDGINYTLVGKDTDTEMSITRPVQTLYSLSPEGQWLYEYEDTEIKCRWCEATFSHTLLESDYDEYGNYENICPKCKRINCCELEFEKIDEHVRRDGKSV